MTFVGIMSFLIKETNAPVDMVPTTDLCTIPSIIKLSTDFLNDFT